MQVNYTKFLVVVTDNKFKFVHIPNNISKGISIITKVRKVLDQTTLMYVSLQLTDSPLHHVLCSCVRKCIYHPGES